MKTPLLITAILVIIIIAGAVTYLAVSVNGGPESALMNARELFMRNVTVTYKFVISSTLVINNNEFPGIPGVPFQTGPLMGIVTISRTPINDATVINGTFSFRHFMGSGINFNVALWRYDNELCYAMELNFMGPQTTTHCIPYVNLTKYVILALNESKYVGKGTWNGKTTYCFTATLTLTPTQGGLQGFPMIMNITELCILSNGVPTNMTIYLYPAYQSEFGGMFMNINMTLISYSFTFNQREFMKITRGLIP
ncbi:hypothetical protein [Vulcanisaeta distributa]|uniref:Uncharacterized protein n=1 Tax=Vulcanisaeta distributa (strain DSM 14429 / JCM 11212 / NBRC 100878 / IC-017) TaxID=572478 RepID=E1QQ26_VULDI|nr:hypothetical protein [Vulcanisaeta distributa]ADN50398.1 hypothetical protein Vdis_1009 [Vulcanisaeta distributa DSM 14429]